MVTFEVKNPKTALPPLREFLTEAGGWAPLLRPLQLGRLLAPLLGVDFFDVAALEQAGLSIEAPMTLSFQEEATVLCASGTKAAQAVERARKQFSGAGQAAKEKHLGALLEGSAAGRIWREGIATKGAQVCFASGGSDALAALRSAAQAMGGAGLGATAAVKAAAGLDAPVMGYFQSHEASGAFEVHATRTALKVVGRMLPRQVEIERPRTSDALGSFEPEALAVVRAVLTPKAMSDPDGPLERGVGFLVSQACRGFDAVTANRLLAGLRPQLTGSVGLVVKGLDSTAAGERGGQYFLVSHAYVLPVKDADAARAALESGLNAIKAKGVQVVAGSEGAQWSVPVGRHALHVGIASGALVVANDAGARDVALAALRGSKPGKLPHALAFKVDGPLATAALRRISLLDVPKSPELAGLFGFGVEAGSLLKACGPIAGFADPDGGGLRFEAGLALGAKP